MKKAVTSMMFLVVLISFSNVRAQLVVPSSDSKIKIRSAHHIIGEYQSQVSPIIHNPSSFIMNAADLASYFASPHCAVATSDWYLHIYLYQPQIYSPGAQNPDTIGLAIVPSVVIYTTTPASPVKPVETMQHDPSYANVFVPCLYQGETTPDAFCAQPDSRLDGVDVPNGAGCNLSTIVDCGSSIQSKGTLDPLIYAYQLRYPQNLLVPTLNNLQSFIFNADSLRMFLLNNTNVHYLQIYFAIDNTYGTPTPTTIENWTLVIVGLDNYGNHIYDSYGTRSWVFDECNPCPVCGITADIVGFPMSDSANPQ